MSERLLKLTPVQLDRTSELIEQVAEMASTECDLIAPDKSLVLLRTVLCQAYCEVAGGVISDIPNRLRRRKAVNDELALVRRQLEDTVKAFLMSAAEQEP